MNDLREKLLSLPDFVSEALANVSDGQPMVDALAKNDAQQVMNIVRDLLAVHAEAMYALSPDGLSEDARWKRLLVLYAKPEKVGS